MDITVVKIGKKAQKDIVKIPENLQENYIFGFAQFLNLVF